MKWHRLHRQDTKFGDFNGVACQFQGKERENDFFVQIIFIYFLQYTERSNGSNQKRKISLCYSK